MTKKLGVVMDPIESIQVKKDSTLAMLVEAQKRGWQLSYMELGDLFMQDNTPMARLQNLSVKYDVNDWFTCSNETITPMASLDLILMRKDPPFNMEYIYATYMLEFAASQGVRVVNDPKSLRDANEKLFILQFPQCCPPLLVSSKKSLIHAFFEKHQDIILKPLAGMGGKAVFHVTPHDPNLSVIIETLTHDYTRPIMCQQFIPEITQGDKRILLIDGKPLPFALARIPAPGDSRGNLAAGAKGVGVELSKRDVWICEQVGPKLQKMGLTFVGLDVIGDYLIEINVTSPTCIRELEAIYDLNISAKLFDAIG